MVEDTFGCLVFVFTKKKKIHKNGTQEVQYNQKSDDSNVSGKCFVTQQKFFSAAARHRKVNISCLIKICIQKELL